MLRQRCNMLQQIRNTLQQTYNMLTTDGAALVHFIKVNSLTLCVQIFLT